MPHKSISIIIVTYNSESDIYECLEAIRQHADIPLEEIELIVVDNNSDNYVSMFSQLKQTWGDDIVLIENSRNGGYGQGNNVGLLASTASVALIMNPDVRLMEPVFQKALQRFGAEENLSILGMKQMLSATRESRNSFCATWLMNGYLRTLLCAVCTRFEWYVPSLMYVQGSCFFVRIDRFKQIGMFDETHFMYGEEEDIHYRMNQVFGGASFGYNPDMRYIHKTLERVPSFRYEKKLIDANVQLYAKKGVARRTILTHFLQSMNMQIWRLRLARQRNEMLNVLIEVRHYLKEELQKQEGSR